MSTVDLTLHLKDAEMKKVSDFFEKLKDLQDVPYEEIIIEESYENKIEVIIRYPLTIFDKTVSQFLAVLFGEFPFMRSFGDVSFVDLVLPDIVWKWFSGPKFGASGIKQRCGINEYPALMAIIKPSIGEFLTVENIKRAVADPVAGGFHFVKDDEMQGDFSYTSLDERINIAHENTNYVPAVNADNIDTYLKTLGDEKISMILLNASIIGFPMLHELSKKTKVPILSHLSLQGTYHHSFSPRMYALLHRLFGCDAFITAIGDTHYYRVEKREELEMVEALTENTPVKKTLPMLTGGGTLNNLDEIMAPYEKKEVPYGIVFGTLVFNSEENPEEMARAVVKKVKEIKAN